MWWALYKTISLATALWLSTGMMCRYLHGLLHCGAFLPLVEEAPVSAVSLPLSPLPLAPPGLTSLQKTVISFPYAPSSAVDLWSLDLLLFVFKVKSVYCVAINKTLYVSLKLILFMCQTTLIVVNPYESQDWVWVYFLPAVQENAIFH